MRAGRGVWLTAAFLAGLAGFFWITSGPEEPVPNPPGTFSFAVLGDAPYDSWEELQYLLVLDALAANDLGFVLHVGDIFWRPCTDEMYRRTLGWFDGLPHPVIYTPGDNEWADCWERRSGSFAPRERLGRLRQLFFEQAGQSRGGTPLAVDSQARAAEFGAYVENVRFAREGIVFATMHLVGSRNAMRPFPARNAADDDEVRERTAAAAVWLRQTFDQAAAADARAVVLAFHAFPFFEHLADDPERQPLEPFLAALEEEVERFSRPVVAVHGDHHDYLVDRPLIDRRTGRRLENFTRMQVPGSPRVGWVRVVVSPGAPVSFAFEPHVVPRWKYW